MKTQSKSLKINFSFLIISIMILLSSCSSVLFKNPQPSNGTSIFEYPKSLQGTYIDEDEDTLFVFPTSTKYGNDSEIFSNNDTLEAGYLELRKFNDYYILNFKDSLYWDIVLVKPEGGNLKTYYIDLEQLGDENAEDVEQSAITKVKKYTKILRIENTSDDNHNYIINPSPKELETMIKMGIFIQMGYFKKID
ncbi:MAG: hypothetical protein R2771_06430 [Saprospiraceae bacterium]